MQTRYSTLIHRHVGRWPAAAVLLAFGVGSQAATVSFTGSYNGATDLSNHEINVAQFDGSLGALQSATFELHAVMDTSAFAINDGDFYMGWDKLIYTLSLVGDAPYASVAIAADGGAQRVMGSGPPGSVFNTSSRERIIGQPDFTRNGPSLTASDAFVELPLAAFIGNGNLSFFLTTQNEDEVSVAGYQTGGMPSPAPIGLRTFINAEVVVTYDYTPVPVPAAAWLLGSALGLLGVVRRRANAF